MLSSKKDGGEGGARGSTRWRFLPVLLALSLLIQGQNAFASGQTTTGTLQVGNTFSYGATSYSLDYSYPTTANVGSNVTITTTLHVDSLGGIIEYISQYRVIVDVFIGTLHVQNASTKSPINGSFLYPGATWGPNNVTIPLTAANTGLAVGASANASVRITLENDDYIHNGPYATLVSEPPMQGFVGGLLLQNVAQSTTSSTSTTVQTSSQTYLPYALLASGAVLMLLAVVALRPSRLPQGTQK
jgi:hypothetical protein